MGRSSELLAIVVAAGTEGVDQIDISRKTLNLKFTSADKTTMAELVASNDVDAITNEVGTIVRWIDPNVRF